MNWIERALLVRSATRGDAYFVQPNRRQGCMGCGCLSWALILTVIVIVMALRS